MAQRCPATDNPLLIEALRLRAKGISVLPIGKDKKPAIPRWKRLQQQAADEAEIRKWFSRSDVTGLGIILGPVSGNLVVRDFDVGGSYEAWAKAFPHLSKTLPTVRTNRGYHVYARITGVRTKDRKEGELRGEGGYVIAPPSRHPTGTVYCWEREVSSLEEIPSLTVEESGFGQIWDSRSFPDGSSEHATERTETPERTDENRRELMRTEENRSHRGREKTASNFVLQETPWLLEAIRETVPTSPGQRNTGIFEFARRLKSQLEYADADASQLEEFVRAWHKVASPNIGTKDFDDTRIDFLKGWDKIKFAHGTGPFAEAMNRLNDAELPRCADRYDDLNKRRLVGLCRELQRITPPGRPFFLSCRTAGKCLDVDHKTANRWLYMLCADGILLEKEKGDKARATRFLYLPAID